MRRAFKKILNFLEKSFAGHGSHLTLLNLISLYTVASELIANYSFTARRASDFRNWFIDFEERRTRRRQSSSGTEDDRDIDFEAYELALVQQTASISSQRTRRNTLMQDFLASTPDLVLRDPQRQFNPDQRYAIYVRAKGKCSNPYGNPECPESLCVGFISRRPHHSTLRGWQNNCIEWTTTLSKLQSQEVCQASSVKDGAIDLLKSLG